MHGRKITRVSAYTVFDTAIGRCGIAWSDRGVASVHLPERAEAETRARIIRRHPLAREALPPLHVRSAIDGIVALMAGVPMELTAIALDLEGVPPFYRRVYEIARTIPAGHTLTYGDVATRLGDPTNTRAVGQALGRNPFPIIVPCHRVLAGGGSIGGFSASGGASIKRRMLIIEGALLQLDL